MAGRQVFKPVNMYGRRGGFTNRKNLQGKAADLSRAPNIHRITMAHVSVTQQKTFTHSYPLTRLETKTSVVPSILVTKLL